jgi:hypothetical protein
MDPECVLCRRSQRGSCNGGSCAITSTQRAELRAESVDHKHPNGLSVSTPRLPVHRRPEEIGVAVVLRVLLDHVADDPSQAGSSTVLPKGRLWSG